MGFNEEYLKLRKKRLKEEENGQPREILTPYRRTLASDVPTAVMKEDGASGDIAPVTFGDYAKENKSNNTVTEENKTEERTWFKKSGLWDDGYQFGDVTKTILAGGQDLWKHAVEGAAKIGEGTVDALLTIAPYVAQGQYYANGGGYNLQADAIANEMFEAGKKGNAEIIKKDIVDEEAVAKFLVEDHHPLSYKYLTGGRSIDADSVFGEKSDALAQSGGQLAATAGLQALGVPWWLTTGATTLGGESENALNQGATLEEAAVSGMISAGAEILTEKISGGISFGGKTLDDALTKELARGISNKAVRTLAKLGIDAVGEGNEELLSGVMSAIGQKLTYADDKEISELFSSEEAFESFIGGVVLGGGSSAISAGKAVISGEDAVTGLKTDTEQKIVDKLYKDELANAEKDGKKLTLKDKQKLYDGVLNSLEKGYISTDVIEEVLGGEDYKTYQNEIKRQQDLDKELNELRNMKSSEMTDIQTERMAELKAMTPNTEMVNALKFGIDEKIRNSIKDTKLVESYNEKARRGEAFKADLSGYDSKQAAVVQKAIDSGILNNTNRTHEFVDMVSKISADKGVLFDFSNNDKLKESGFALEGKTINGFVTKDGVTLNIDSQKSLNSVVGHEIAHVLEGTELYTELSKAITEYAKGKGDYQGRYDSLSALYKGIEGANIDAELTADLVGDYLFTDADFVNNLSTEHRNVFEKIFDEIKYLYKVATAGSKEARELEKVKKVFEEAYKGNTKNTANDSGVKYSLNIKHTDGSVEVLADARNLTNEQAIGYLKQAARGELRRDTYIPVRKDTPQVIIDTLEQVNENISNSSLVMQVRKAKQSMATENPGGQSVAHGNNVRSHGLSPEEVIDIINKLDDPSAAVYQTNRKDKNGKPLPNNAAFFVEYNKNGAEGVAVIEFDSSIDSDSVGTEFGDTNYHTVITVFEPDTQRNGIEFDYVEELLSNPDNFELEIKRRQSTGSATGEKHPNTSSKSPSIEAIIPQKEGNVNTKFSISSDSDGRKLSPAVATRFGNSKAVDENGSLKVLYHGTAAGEFSIFDKSKGSVEGDFGSGFYFTDNDTDVSEHYEGGGPDFDNKVGRRADEIWGDEPDIEYEEAERRAREELYKGAHKFEVYLNIENPAIVGETQLLTQDKYLEEYDPDDYDNEDDYYGDVEQLVMDDIDGIIWDIDRNIDVNNTDGIANVLYDAYYNGGIGIEELKKAINDLYLEDSNGNLVGNEVTRQIIESLGYDGIIDSTVSGKWRNMNIEPGTTHYIVFKPNQIKAITNESPTDNPDIHRSLSAEGSTPKRYGNYNVYGKDIGLDRGNIAPMREDISDVENTTEGIPPVADKAVDETYPEGFAPMEHSAMYESEVKDNQAQMDRLAEEASRLYSEGKADEAQAIIEQMQALNESGKDARNRYNALRTQERADTEGYLNSLTDADAPPEIEAPYYEDGGIIDPFDERDVKKVGDRKVKSFMAENPEVKPYFQAEANILLGELNNSIKGERFYTATPDGHLDKDGGMTYGSDSYGVWSGTSRSVTPDIEQLLDNAKGDGKGYSYDEIRAGLEAIIKGDANNACSKRIEFVINDRLMNGYITDGGVEVPANQEYRDLIKSQGVLEGRDEAFKQLIKDTNKVERAQMEDIAPLPTFDTASEKQIPGQQTMFENAPIKEAPIKNTAAESTGEEPKIAKVLTEEPKTDKKRGNAWSMFKNNVLDKGMVFETLSLKTGNRELQAKWNSIRYAKSRAQQLIGKGDGNVKSLTSIQEKVEKSGKTQEFFDYLYHLHNVDRMSLEGKAQARIKELESKFGPLMPEQVVAISLKEITDKTTERTANTIREAKEYLNALETKNKPVFGDEVTADISRATAAKFEKANPEFKQWAQEVYDYTNNLREMLVDEGVISQETADLWAEIYPHYVPIRRQGKDGPAVNVALDTNRTGINAPIKRATGGNSDILPLFDTMALRTEQTYRAIAKNRFGVELKNTLGTTIDRGDMSLDDAIDNLDNDEGLLKEGKNGANPTFTVFENGERVEFEITEEMYDAIKPTGKGLSYTNKVANTVGNVFRGLLTEYNPVFMVTNGIKDAQDVLINSQHAGKTYANIPVAIKEMATKGHWYKEYIANGGEQNTYFDSDSATFKATDKGIKKIVGMPLRAISAVNNTIERLPRLAEYIASRKSGASVDISMLDAARVTTNFAAGGDLTKALNRNGFTFLNASTQGAIQQVRNVREAKANGLKGWLQLAGKTAIAGIPALILNDLLWDDDEEYEELSDYIKQNYYVVAKFGDGKFVRIPKGRTVAVIQDAFEQINNARTGDDEVDMQSFFELAIGNLAPNNPLENNIIAPIMQVANNKTWYGEDLVPSRLQDLPDAEQYDESTDSISKWLGEKLDYSPYKINYLLNQYSGGIGDVALPMLTPESDGSGVLAPFADKFTTDSTMKNQNVTDFYETVDNLTKNANSANATDEDILKNKYMGTIRTELGELYAEKREIQNSNLSDAEKNAAVREIQEQINAKAKESLDTYGTVNIDGKYATVGDIHYRWYEPSEDSDAEPGWEKITDQQLEKQKKVTSGLGITPSEYWSDNKEYDFAYEYPEKYKFLNENGVTYDDYANGDEKFKEAWTWASKNPGKYTMSKVFSDDLLTFYGYRSEANDIKGVDEDGDGRTDSGTKKTNVINWLNGRDDLDYGQKIILYRSMYNSKQDREDYNMDIIDYLNSRNDISYAQMKTILEELGMKVDSKGYITWD